MLSSRLIPFAALLTLTGCGTVDVLRLDATLRPQRPPDAVRLIAQEPRQPYTVIALINVTGGSWLVPDQRTRLLRLAAQLGGDAVLLGAQSLSRVGSGGDGGTTVQLSGKVIVFNQVPQPANSP